jgi:hypothetical protein
MDTVTNYLVYLFVCSKLQLLLSLYPNPLPPSTQVMPPGLEDRARFFPRISTKQQQTPGYFDAPAAGVQPLGGPKLNPVEPLPDVVIVFCTLEK